MRYQLRNKLTLEHIRYQNFEGVPPDLSEQKQLEWVEAELPEPMDENFYDNTIIHEAPWLVSTPKPIEEVKAMVWERIKEKRDDIQDNGGCEVGGKWYHTDTKSKLQQMALVQMGAGIPPDLYWKTMDGSFVQMTQALAGQIFAAQAAREQAVFVVAETHMTTINALQSVEDVKSYDYSTGWPQTFAEWQAEQ